MKYALIDGVKVEAQPGLRGFCTHCQSNMIAKCGNERIKHWAHKSKVSCDPWWENETEWHRAWKNRFPVEWQEVIHKDPTTEEKHIADIKTDKAFVIEFQRSAIDPHEIKSREAFYKNMVWVVDSARLKSDRDYTCFCKGFTDRKPTIVDGYFRLPFPNRCFRKNWLENSKPVYFDFQGFPHLNQQDEQRADLWCLLPGREDQCAIVARISREQFMHLSLNDPRSLPTRDKFSDREKNLQAQFAEAVEAAKKIKELRAAQAAAHQQYLRSLIPRRFIRRPL